jgi:hypothetical protein
MIFLKVLKYNILDYCIDVMFSKINKTFSGKPLRVLPKDLYVGLELSSIHSEKNPDITYETCKIVDYNRSGDGNHYRIEFHCKFFQGQKTSNNYVGMTILTQGDGGSWRFYL